MFLYWLGMFATCFMALFVRHDLVGFKYLVFSFIGISFWPLFCIWVFILYLRNSREHYFQFIENDKDTFMISFSVGRLFKKFSEADKIMSQLGIFKCSENATVGHYSYNGKTKQEIINILKSKGWIEIGAEEPKEE